MTMAKINPPQIIVYQGESILVRLVKDRPEFLEYELLHDTQAPNYFRQGETIVHVKGE